MTIFFWGGKYQKALRNILDLGALAYFSSTLYSKKVANITPKPALISYNSTAESKTCMHISLPNIDIICNEQSGPIRPGR